MKPAVGAKSRSRDPATAPCFTTALTTTATRGLVANYDGCHHAGDNADIYPIRVYTVSRRHNVMDLFAVVGRFVFCLMASSASAQILPRGQLRAGRHVAASLLPLRLQGRCNGGRLSTQRGDLGVAIERGHILLLSSNQHCDNATRVQHLTAVGQAWAELTLRDKGALASSYHQRAKRSML